MAYTELRRFVHYRIHCRSQDKSDHTMTRLCAGQSEVHFPAEARCFSDLQSVQTDSRVNSGSCFGGTEVISPATMRPACVAAHLVKIGCSFTSPSPVCRNVATRTLASHLLIAVQAAVKWWLACSSHAVFWKMLVEQ